MKLQLFIVPVVFLFAKLSCISSLNYRPIIGVMSEELTHNVKPLERSFIMAYYVKFLEASGARVVPVLIYQPEQYYKDLLKKINGVLLPGGGDILESSGYGRTAKIIFDIATEMNEEGDYFPLWGTCLGFEFLNYAPKMKMWMKACSADDMAANIELTDDYKESRMFSRLSEDMKEKIGSENVSLHLHHWCITPQNYSLSGLDKYYRVLSVSKDFEGLPFVSIIEAFNKPFYGVSFHPERVVFDWTIRKVPTPRTLAAIEISQFFGNFFVNEARKSYHRFPTEEEENAHLIYNYNPEISGEELSAQMYLFQ